MDFKIYIDSMDVNNRVYHLAAEIEKEYKDKDKVVIVGVMNGAYRFMSDLTSWFNFDHEQDFIRAKSYEGEMSTGSVDIIDNTSCDVYDKDVILIEDIIDTGLTLSELVKYYKGLGAKSVKTVALLDKKCKRTVDYNADFVGFEIEDKFVIGYGLDYNQRFRHLDDICIYKSLH